MYLSPLTVFVASVLAGVVRASQDAIPMPSEEDWYVPPSNVSDYAPGEMIREREVSNELNGYFTGGTTVQVNSSHQIMYRTTDSLGNAVAHVMTLLVPNNADPTKLIAHQTAYDSATVNCAPSYSLRAGANNTADEDIIYIAAALDKGWYVSTADYNGMQGQFTAGVSSGQSTLDSVRATLAEGPKYGLSPDAKYALFGYSGGSIACEWAAELQESYAPELDFAGVAIGGTVPNLTASLMLMNKGISAGLVMAGIIGLGHAYPNFTDFLNQHLLASKRDDWDAMGRNCLNAIMSQGAGQDVFSYMDGGIELMADDVPASVLQIAGMAGERGTPKMPIFLIDAIADEVSPNAETDALYQRLCDKGAVVEYHKDVVGEHVSESLTAGPSALEWIGERLEGNPVSNTGCVEDLTILTSIDAALFPVVGQVVVALLKTSIFGGQLGPQNQDLGIIG